MKYIDEMKGMIGMCLINVICGIISIGLWEWYKTDIAWIAISVMVISSALIVYWAVRGDRRHSNVKLECILCRIDEGLKDPNIKIKTKNKSGGIIGMITFIKEQMLKYFMYDQISKEEIERIYKSKNHNDVQAEDILIRLKHLLDPKVDIGNVHYGYDGEEEQGSGGGLFG